MIVRCFCLRLMSLLVVAAGVAVSGEAVASPARRLARRGVVVVPVPGAAVVVPPVAIPAPIVVGPVPRPRRWGAVPAAPLAVPVPVRVTVREKVRVAGPQPAATSAVAAAAAGTATPAPVSPKPTPAGAATPEAIAAPLPAPAGEPTAAERSSPGDEQAAFTPAWYASHPQAWRPARSPADWWRGADLATVTSWLGRPVSTAGAAADGAGAITTAGADEVGADGLKSVLVLPAGHDNAAAAAGGDWLPLGVFAVVPQGEATEGRADGQHHNYQQLAVDRQGTIQGNFYDAISDTLQPIVGTVDRDTLTASWTVGTNGSRFTAPVRAFTAPPRTVGVASGATSRQLQMLPLQRPQ